MRGRKRRERIEESKNVQTTPSRTYCERRIILPYCIQIVGRPDTGSLPSTIAPPPTDKDRERWVRVYGIIKRGNKLLKVVIITNLEQKQKSA